MSKRRRNLSRRELVIASRALATERGCTCPRPTVHVLREGPAPHVQLEHAAACPMLGHPSTFDVVAVATPDGG